MLVTFGLYVTNIPTPPLRRRLDGVAVVSLNKVKNIDYVVYMIKCREAEGGLSHINHTDFVRFCN